MAHGRPCRARTVHHASYLCWRLFGRELPLERVSLCHPVHDRISRWHQGWMIPSVLLFLLTWLVIGWARVGVLWRRRGRVGVVRFPRLPAKHHWTIAEQSDAVTRRLWEASRLANEELDRHDREGR